MSDEITLYCWIRGTDIDEQVGAIISRNETVDALKRRLLLESRAIDVPAAALRLYKPIDPVVEPYDEYLRTVTISKLGKQLPASRKLSSVFEAAPPEDHIHIIVGMWQR
jgi:hypothetical protein